MVGATRYPLSVYQRLALRRAFRYVPPLERPAESDIDLLGELSMPVKALNQTL